MYHKAQRSQVHIPIQLIDRVPEELWTEVHDIVQETGIKTILKKKKCKKAKWLSEEALQIAVKSVKMGSIKDRNGRDLTEAEDIKKR